MSVAAEPISRWARAHGFANRTLAFGLIGHLLIEQSSAKFKFGFIVDTLPETDSVF